MGLLCDITGLVLWILYVLVLLWVYVVFTKNYLFYFDTGHVEWPFKTMEGQRDKVSFNVVIQGGEVSLSVEGQGVKLVLVWWCKEVKLVLVWKGKG